MIPLTTVIPTSSNSSKSSSSAGIIVAIIFIIIFLICMLYYIHQQNIKRKLLEMKALTDTDGYVFKLLKTSDFLSCQQEDLILEGSDITIQNEIVEMSLPDYHQMLDFNYQKWKIIINDIKEESKENNIKILNYLSRENSGNKNLDYFCTIQCCDIRLGHNWEQPEKHLDEINSRWKSFLSVKKKNVEDNLPTDSDVNILETLGTDLPTEVNICQIDMDEYNKKTSDIDRRNKIPNKIKWKLIGMDSNSCCRIQHYESGRILALSQENADDILTNEKLKLINKNASSANLENVGKVYDLFYVLPDLFTGQKSVKNKKTTTSEKKEDENIELELIQIDMSNEKSNGININDDEKEAEDDTFFIKPQQTTNPEQSEQGGQKDSQQQEGATSGKTTRIRRKKQQVVLDSAGSNVEFYDSGAILREGEKSQSQLIVEQDGEDNGKKDENVVSTNIENGTNKNNIANDVVQDNAESPKMKRAQSNRRLSPGKKNPRKSANVVSGTMVFAEDE